MKSENVNNLLRIGEAPHCLIQIVAVLDDLAAGIGYVEVQRIVRRHVEWTNAADVDGIEEDSGRGEPVAPRL